MKVFAVYSSDKANLVRVWSESWESNGWVPQLLSQKEIEEAGTPRKAVEKRGGGILTDLLTVNFSCRRPPLRAKRFGKPQWEAAPLVRFAPGVTEDAIRECGRSWH